MKAAIYDPRTAGQPNITRDTPLIYSRSNPQIYDVLCPSSETFFARGRTIRYGQCAEGSPFLFFFVLFNLIATQGIIRSCTSDYIPRTFLFQERWFPTHTTDETNRTCKDKHELTVKSSKFFDSIIRGTSSTVDYP